MQNKKKYDLTETQSAVLRELVGLLENPNAVDKGRMYMNLGKRAARALCKKGLVYEMTYGAPTNNYARYFASRAGVVFLKEAQENGFCLAADKTKEPSR